MLGCPQGLSASYVVAFAVDGQPAMMARIPYSTYCAGCRKALGQPLDLYDIRKFDAALGATLEKLYTAHKAHQGQGSSRKGPLLVDGCPIEDLCLTFVLPGYPEYELKKNGGDITVDASNVGAYITAVVDANLESGIKAQMDSFR